MALHSRPMPYDRAALPFSTLCAFLVACSTGEKSGTPPVFGGQGAVVAAPGEQPLPAETLDTFHLNSYADLKGTSMSVALCPGGGKPAANPKAGAAPLVGVGAYASSLSTPVSPHADTIAFAPSAKG